VRAAGRPPTGCGGQDEPFAGNRYSQATAVPPPPNGALIRATDMPV